MSFMYFQGKYTDMNKQIIESRRLRSSFTQIAQSTDPKNYIWTSYVLCSRADISASWLRIHLENS